MIRRNVIIMLAALAIMALVVGCASKKEAFAPATPIQELDAPDWVTKGGGAFDSSGAKVFYGVGSASGIKNHSLLRSTADNRARNDIAMVFEAYSSSLMKDYMASTMAGDPNVSSEEQHVEQAIRTVTSMTLSGVAIIDHWQNPQSGEYFSLARLDMEAFKGVLDGARDLDAKVKAHIKENADRLHGELNAEMENREKGPAGE